MGSSYAEHFACVKKVMINIDQLPTLGKQPLICQWKSILHDSGYFFFYKFCFETIFTVKKSHFKHFYTMAMFA